MEETSPTTLHEYWVNDDKEVSPTAPSKLYIYSAPQVAKGPPIILGKAADLKDKKWIYVSTGKINSLGTDAVGICTTGQFSCYCVIVALLDDTGTSVTSAYFTHSSYWDHDCIKEIATKVDSNALVVIAARASMKDRMENIKAKMQPKNPKLIHMYYGVSYDKFGFGIGRDGLIGQVVGDEKWQSD